MSVDLSHRVVSIFDFVRLIVYVSVCLFASLPVCFSVFYINLFSVYVTVCMAVCLSAFYFVCLFVYPSVSIC